MAKSTRKRYKLMIIVAIFAIISLIWIYDVSLLLLRISRYNEIEINEDTNKLPINVEYCSTILNNNENTDPHFIHLNERQLKLRHKWPPYLISFGGSGNSYIRLIIEDVTSIYSGAIYSEPVYEKLGFAGKQCTDNVIVVKAHTFHIMQHSVQLRKFLKSQCICNCNKKINRKYGATQQLEDYKAALNEYKLNATYNIKPALLPWMNVSAIFLIRDPWKSAWSAMQMQHGERLNAERVGGEMDQKNIFHNIHTRHMPKYSKITRRQMVGTITDYIRKDWLDTFILMDMFKENGLEYIVLRLESFMSKDKEEKDKEWDKLFGFLLNKEWFRRNYNDLRRRMKCAELIGDGHDKMRLIHRHKKNVSDDGKMEYWNISQVYDFWSDERMCYVWYSIKDIAEKYGYKKWENEYHIGVNCDKMINVTIKKSEFGFHLIRLNEEMYKDYNKQRW